MVGILSDIPLATTIYLPDTPQGNVKTRAELCPLPLSTSDTGHSCYQQETLATLSCPSLTIWQPEDLNLQLNLGDQFKERIFSALKDNEFGMQIIKTLSCFYSEPKIIVLFINFLSLVPLMFLRIEMMWVYSVPDLSIWCQPTFLVHFNNFVTKFYRI